MSRADGEGSGADGREPFNPRGPSLRSGHGLPLLHVHAARRVADRFRFEPIGRPVEQLGYAALMDVLAVDAAVALVMRRRHVVVSPDHSLEVAVDDRVAVIAEDVVR